jgi:hypothetical protein
MSEFEKWVASFTSRKHLNRQKYTIDRIDPHFCIVLDCSHDTDNPELSANTCDIIIERLTECVSDEEEPLRLVADADKHGVMRFIAAIGISRFDDKVKSAFYEVTQPVMRNVD